MILLARLSATVLFPYLLFTCSKICLISIFTLFSYSLSSHKQRNKAMAYAAITCLMSNIQQSMQLTQLDLQSFYGKFKSLRGILEKPRKSASYHDEALLSLEARIMELADAAGYEVDSLSRNVFMAETTDTRSRSFWKLCCFLDQAVEGIDSTMKHWLAIVDTYSNIEAQNLALVSTPELFVEPINVMVGHENQFEMMLNRITRGASELQVVSIVGMGGIGKTTLANKIYTDPSILSRFDILAKVVVSQEYSVRRVLVGLLSSIRGKSDEFTGEDDGKLSDRVQKLLKSGRRYLIFIDDIWTTGAWDDIKLCFPDYSCGSRILLTTRNMEVAEYASSGMPPYQMPLLTFDESWSLLYEKVFVNDCFPLEFEQIGKQIALNCGGLPLAIVVIAGLLFKAGKALDEWKSIADNVTSSVSTDLGGQCMRVVGLSYHHLPHHLKACFLYLAIYPEDELIFVGKLIKLWSAEGFMKGEETMKSTEVAELCLKDLMDRNLIFIHHLSFDGRIEACGMHDVIRELCLREARSINSVNVINESQNPCDEQSKQKHQGRISIQSEDSTFASAQLATSCYNECRSILLFIQVPSVVSKMPEFVEKLRVLDLASVDLDGFPSCIVNLFHLRYLSLRVDLSKRRVYIPPSIANLLYLQTLILERARSATAQFSRFRLTSEIFKMSQLRHLSLYDSYLDHQYHEFGEGSWILRNLESLSGWNPEFCTSSVFRLFPNVKTLMIGRRGVMYTGKKCLDDLFYLDKLEELELGLVYDLIFPPLDSFPKNLKTLSFDQTRVCWEDLRIVGKLPKLEALKLVWIEYVDPIWEVVGEGFPSLKFLQLIKCFGFKYWKASSDQFPCLERLFVESCRALESIPQEFAEVTTLKLINIRHCSESLANSAKKIQQESEDNYERSVEVVIYKYPVIGQS